MRMNRLANILKLHGCSRSDGVAFVSGSPLHVLKQQRLICQNQEL